jgi:hypothetical protein
MIDNDGNIGEHWNTLYYDYYLGKYVSVQTGDT